MASHADFKKLAEDRLKLAEYLMSVEQWWIAAYMLGFVLECVLKAGTCKALNISEYPDTKNPNKNISRYFQTHDYTMLLLVSGASDLFGFSNKGSSSWSGFVQEFQGKTWTSPRYDLNVQFDETRVKRMHQFLIKIPDGIIPLMTSENKW